MPVTIESNHLPPVMRLALAYAPREGRAAWLAAFALDARLAALVRQAREPLLAQIRLAWWRDRLAEPPATWPAGEPLLAAIGAGVACPEALAPIVDGWEALLGEAPLARDELLAAARARALGLLAAVPDQDVQAGEGLALRWALADLAAHVSHPEESASMRALHRDVDLPSAARTRSLRPLVVLEGLASRSLQALDSQVALGLGGLLLALRLGMLGR